MSTQKFWLLLGGTCLITLVCLGILQLVIPKSDALSNFTMLCIAVFLAINIAAYYLGKGAAESSSKYRFIHLMMILIIVKMFICVALVLFYVKIGQPSTKLFVIPFLLIYLTFTIFEIHVLQKLAKVQPAGEQTK